MNDPMFGVLLMATASALLLLLALAITCLDRA